ncbi:MAG TPA: hypothetical protein VGV09_20545 [Steroidobacteraceae bacterium]|nr:hypothetical protein [Steroidobacteraceae bacterium]
MSLLAITAVRAGSPTATVRAANVNEFVEDVRVNIADQRTIEVFTAFSRSDPEGTVHKAKIDDRYSVESRLRASDALLVQVNLVDSKSGMPKVLSSKTVEANTGQTAAINFSVCGDRIIRILGGTDTGSCARLPPVAKVDPQSAQCQGYCTGPYEGMPVVAESRARIAPVSEPGEPLTISGRVFGPDGRPRSGIIVYAYHTNRLGIYPPPVPPRSQASYDHGQLRGWARTDAEGRYEFDTIRPGSYPHSHNPQHVHMSVIEPGCMTYFIKELQFSDDPMRAQFTNEERKEQEDAAIETPRKTAKGWEVTRDIRLGEGVKGYHSCSPAGR